MEKNFERVLKRCRRRRWRSWRIGSRKKKIRRRERRRKKSQKYCEEKSCRLFM